MLGQGLKVLVWLSHRVDHRQRCLLGAHAGVERSELGLSRLVGLAGASLKVGLAGVLVLRVVIIAEVRNTLFLARCTSPIDLVLIIFDRCDLRSCRCLLHVFQVYLLSIELDYMICFALVDIPKLAHERLDALVGAHLGHSIREVVELVLWREVHVPLFVHSHYLVQVGSLVTFAAQLQQTLFAAMYH